jgi:hypothetical protein
VILKLINLFKLFFRKDVSYSCPEGRRWVVVSLPKNSNALSCSCSATGELCVLTQNEVLIRSQITRDSPYGSAWIYIQTPENCNGLRQVQLGRNSVWMLDNQGKVYFRAGITAKCPQGNRWVTIAASMLNISVSMENQLWGINSNDNSMYVRYGIDEENPSGISWKKVNLKFKKVHRICLIPDDSSQTVDSNYSNASAIKDDDDLKSSASFSSSLQAVEPENSQQYVEGSIYGEEYPSWYENPVNDETNNIPNRLSIDILTESTNIEEVAQKVEQTNLKLDQIIKDLMNKEDQTQLVSDLSVVQPGFLEKSSQKSELDRKDSEASSLRGSISSRVKRSERSSSMSSMFSVESYEFTFLNLNLCSVNSFSLASSMIPSNWFDESVIISKEENSKEWKRLLLDLIRKRNFKEHTNIDKITVFYENDVDLFYKLFKDM